VHAAFGDPQGLQKRLAEHRDLLAAYPLSNSAISVASSMRNPPCNTSNDYFLNNIVDGVFYSKSQTAGNSDPETQ
jgi:hypothetical protein